MAYQKLQAGRALSVIPSDTVNIPNIAAVSASGTTTAGTTDKLTDTGGDFLNKRVAIGDIIYSTKLLRCGLPHNTRPSSISHIC